MRLLVIFAAIVLAAVALNQSDDTPQPVSPLLCPDCPGGVCPLPKTPSNADIGVYRQPTQILDDPVIAAAPVRAELTLLKRATTRNAGPVFGPNGWRIRLFLPPGKNQRDRGESIVSWFERDNWLREFAEAYGYQPVMTDDEQFLNWHSKGFKDDSITVVMVDKKQKVRYYAVGSEIPNNLADLRIALAEATYATTKLQRKAPECACEVGGK